VNKLGFTHVEFLPVMEHPFFGSWGYQVTGYYAPTSRYGTPQDFMYLVDYLHQQGIGVILDWVPSHFPTDEHGLGYFDGTHLYEHADPRKGFHPDWKSAIFNYSRNEVRAFLISNAIFWLDRYHVDGLRMDAIASMLYLDYSRKAGEWIPNQFGGRENLDAVSLLKRVNTEAYGAFPDIETIAEESTAWPMVSRPTYIGGLGFGMKWDMGWMHDTLAYMQQNPIHRKYHHNKLTFRGLYAFTENFVLPLSHDEVVHGKGSLMGKMAGDNWQKFANLRLLFGYMYSQPGKKLLFMGGEIAQWSEWNHDGSVDWALLRFPMHEGMQRWVSDLNKFYRNEPALYQYDFNPNGWRWIDANDSDNSVLTFLRMGLDPEAPVLVACNFTPVPRRGYRVGVPHEGMWHEVLNSNAEIYGGTDEGNFGGRQSEPIPMHGYPNSLLLNLPPLAVAMLKRE
jgi:1,4-alpha-glucan branching enzyme